MSGRRERRLVLALLLPACIVFAASIALSGCIDWAPMIPLGVVAAGLAAWLVLAAACGSRGAIIAYLAVLVFLIDAQFRVRDAGDISGDWQSALKFLVWLGSGVIGVPHLPPWRRLLGHPGSALWLAYIAIALVSALYSPAPGYSFGCALALLCLFAFAYAIITRLSPADLFWTITLVLAVFNIVGWLVYFGDPVLGVSAAWTTSGMLLRMCGLAGQATNLGAVCAIAVGVVFLLWRGGHCSLATAILFGGFACVTLAKSDARTAEIATLAGIALVLVSRSTRLVVALGLSGIAGVIVLQLFPRLPGLLGASFSRSGDPTEVYTLTGRLEIWSFAWQQITRSLAFGYGYNSSKVVLGSHVGFLNGLMVDSAHNMYLQNLLSVGVVGCIPLILVMLWLLGRNCVRPVAIELYFIAVVLVSSISDTDAIGTTPTLLTLMFFIISIWSARLPVATAFGARARQTSTGQGISRVTG